MKVKDYKNLKIWEKGIAIVDQVYALTESFPQNEIYGLTRQMRRSAVSIPSNIAEGFVRHKTNEYRHFLYISLGSCAELETQLIISGKRAYVSQKENLIYLEAFNHAMRMISRLISSLSFARDTSDESRATEFH